MRYVSATEAKQRFAALLDAAQRKPVMIRGQNRDVAVLLSPQEYDWLRAFNTHEFNISATASRARTQTASHFSDSF